MTTDHQGAEALDKCKHCGSEDLFLNVYSHYVACERCGISTRDYDSVAEAIAAWNRRPEPASDLRAAAQAVVDRWDSPQWKDEPHTAEFINRLRRALEAVGGDGLPELPEPTNAGSKGYGQLWSPLFTADQMRQYALDALAARAEKAPLSDKQIMRAWLDCTEPGCSATDAFVAGIRFAEKHHGIAPPSDSAAEGKEKA